MDEPSDQTSEIQAASTPLISETGCGTTMLAQGDSVNAKSAPAKTQTNSIVSEGLTGHQTTVVDEHDTLDSEKTLVLISYVAPDTGIWVTDVTKSDDLKNIMEQMASLETSKLEDPQLDDLCGARDSTDGKWSWKSKPKQKESYKLLIAKMTMFSVARYRAKIIALKPNTVVQFIDFGNQAEVDADTLVLLPDELKRDPPLATKVHLIWENHSSSEAAASLGDLLEVKYDGKEADGTITYQVVSVKGTSDTDEAYFDDELSTNEGADTEETVSAEGATGDATLSKAVDDLSLYGSSNGSIVASETPEEASHGLKPTDSSSHDGSELGHGYEQLSGASSPHFSDVSAHENIVGTTASVDELAEAQTASNLRAEAHATVQEMLKKLEEKLPAQDEQAQQARLEVERAMKEFDGRLPVQEDTTVQVQLQKMMESLDERLQKQQEAALSSMRQMMEKTLSESLRKIDRIQRDLHKLYERTSNSAKPSRRDHPENQQAGDAERSNEQAYLRNQYNRQPHRNFGPPTSDFSSDRGTHQQKFDHFGSKPSEQRVMSSALAMRQANAPPGKDFNYRVAKNTLPGSSDPNHCHGISQFKPTQEDQVGQVKTSPEKRSVAFRLQQARGTLEGGDPKMNSNSFAQPLTAPASNIISVVNLPEAVNIDFLCTLFGVYGNVVRAKMLFQQKGRALVEMADSCQTSATLHLLNGVQLFGHKIHLRQCTFDKLIINPLELTNNTAKDYSKLNSHQLNAFRRHRKGMYDPSRLVKPSDTLRVNNILKSVADEEVKAAFIDKGFAIKSIFFIQGKGDSEKKTALVTLESVDEACKALHTLHNVELRDWVPMKISFGSPKREWNVMGPKET